MAIVFLILLFRAMELTSCYSFITSQFCLSGQDYFWVERSGKSIIGTWYGVIFPNQWVRVVSHLWYNKLKRLIILFWITSCLLTDVMLSLALMWLQQLILLFHISNSWRSYHLLCLKQWFFKKIKFYQTGKVSLRD